MQIQLNTDNHILGTEMLAERVEAEIGRALERFADRLTRVEVHLNDVNSDKSGADDKRCMLEARAAGHPPISVTHQAPTLPLALSGASDKLVRALDRALGKRDDARRSGPGVGSIAATDAASGTDTDTSN